MTAPESNQRQDWVQVAEVSQVWQGELIVGRLRASGIEAEIVNGVHYYRSIEPSIDR